MKGLIRSTVFKRKAPLCSFRFRTFSNSDDLINARSAIFFDPAKPFKQLVKGNMLRPGLPSYGHILSAYAIYEFENSVYNYNKIGEFSLHLCAGETQYPNNSDTLSTSHSLLVLPEGIFLHSIRRTDIPTIYKLLSNQEFITESKLSQLRVTCPHIEAKRVEKDHHIIILNVNDHYFNISQAQETITWFKEELKASDRDSVSYVITKDFENPNDRQSIQLYLFPQRDSFNGVVTKQQVSGIVQKSFRWHEWSV